MSQPYFEHLEDLRKQIDEILRDSSGLTIQDILDRVENFRVPTTRHLVAVLARDPKGRFKCEEKIWKLKNKENNSSKTNEKR